MLPKLSELELSFQTTSSTTFICDRKDLITGESYGREIDYDVKLFNGVLLQRPLVWTHFQKSEWIWSLLVGRPFPPVAINKTKNSYQVIDGKQRMHAIGEFLRGEFTLFHGSEEFFFSDLSKEYQNKILYHRPVLGYMVYGLTDYQKLQWFRYINYAGPAQDKEHIETIETLLQAEKTNGN